MDGLRPQMKRVEIVDVGVEGEPFGSKNAMRMCVLGFPIGAPFRFSSPTRKRLEPTRTSLEAITGIAFAPGASVGFEIGWPPGVVGDEEEPQADKAAITTTRPTVVQSFTRQTLAVSAPISRL